MVIPMRLAAVLSAFMMLSCSCATVQDHWETTRTVDTIAAYDSFLEKYPDSQFSAEARQELEQHRWAAAASQDTIDAYQDYLNQHPSSGHSQEATSRLEALQTETDWRHTKESDSIEGYESFIRNHAHTQYSELAQSRLRELREQFSIWQSVLQQNSIDTYRSFIKRYPNSPYAIKAKTIVTEWEKDISGWPIVDALDNQRVQVEVIGSGIQSVSMKIRRTGDRAVKVVIPVGSYFVCGGSSQNMISRQERTISLNTGEWHTLTVPAACTNRSLAIPDSSDRFTVRASPRQAELKRLLTVIEEENVPFAVEQAAIWIVTDNADYADLGVLVSRPTFQAFGGTRVIREEDAARAMRLCFEAGIDITRKAIWADRSAIVQGVQDEALKETVRNWLRKVEGSQ